MPVKEAARFLAHHGLDGIHHWYSLIFQWMVRKKHTLLKSCFPQSCWSNEQTQVRTLRSISMSIHFPQKTKAFRLVIEAAIHRYWNSNGPYFGGFDPNTYLVGGFNHLETYEFVNGKDDNPYSVESHKIHVPNHQPYKSGSIIIFH